MPGHVGGGTGPILVIGESLIDLVLGPGQPRRRAAVSPGGSPANVAVGLRRLQTPAVLATRFGTDRHGALIRAHLAANDVALAPGSELAGTPTCTATARVDSTGAATYEFDIRWQPPPLVLPFGCSAVHTGSIAAVLPPGAGEVERFLGSLAGEPVTITYDPNVRPAISPDPDAAWQRIRLLAGLVDLVKLSAEDCAFVRPGVPAARVADQLLGDRTRCVVVTAGAGDALAWTLSAQVTVAAPAIEVRDTVGAGDSFMAALLAALHRRELLGGTRLAGIDAVLTEIVEIACRAASITCTRVGADPPTAAELRL